MYRVALVNMPFASAQLPSIALAQLRSRLHGEHGDRAQAEVFHLNHDCARELSPQLYDLIAGQVQAVTAGLGDWYFKLAAFPEMDDDPDRYFKRHFAEHRAQLESLKGALLHKRQRAGEFLDRLIDRYQLDGYDMVGFTSMFSQNVACFAMAQRLKRRNPELVTVMGGANCETSMGRVIADNVESIDYVFSGPSLLSFPALVGHLLDGDRAAAAKVGGVYTRRRGLALVDTAPKIGDELGIEVPVPLDYDDFLTSREQKLPDSRSRPMIMFETSRGCWWGERSHCTFCGLNGMTMKYRGMPAEQALEQFEQLFERYADRVDHFQSVDNIMPREYLTDVFPQLETPEGLEIFYEVKADLKDHEMEIMAAARVTQIQPGIEALNTATLKLMRKGTTAFQNIRFLKSCLTYGIEPHWNLLVGFPDEEEEVYAKYVEDLPSLHHLYPPSGAYPVRFDRFSPYYKAAEEWGLDLVPCEFYRMIYPFPEEELADLAYFFSDGNYDAPYIGRTARWLGKMREKMAVWHSLWEGYEQGRVPKLEFRRSGEREVVHDTRSGELVEHQLDAADLTLLHTLHKHHRPDRLADAVGLDAGDVEARLGALHEARLVFEERGMYIGLVLEEQVAVDPAVLQHGEAAERAVLQTGGAA